MSSLARGWGTGAACQEAETETFLGMDDSSAFSTAPELLPSHLPGFPSSRTEAHDAFRKLQSCRIRSKNATRRFRITTPASFPEPSSVMMQYLKPNFANISSAYSSGAFAGIVKGVRSTK